MKKQISRKDFLKGFAATGLAAVAVTALGPRETALAGVSDNLASEKIQDSERAIAELQTKMGTTSISASIGGTVTDALANAVYIESWDPDTKELRLRSASYVSEDV